MTNLLYPYLGFNGNAKEAMEFYKSIFGGKLTLVRYKEFPDMPQGDSDRDKIMHALLEADGIRFMAADMPSTVAFQPGNTMSLAISGNGEEALLSGYFTQLAAGGTITMPFETAPWGSKFGMLTDKFGVQWMVDVGSNTPHD